MNEDADQGGVMGQVLGAIDDVTGPRTNGDATAASYIVPDRPPSAVEAQHHVRALLAHIGEDPQRDGLLGTPGRVVRALAELTSGYHVDIAELLAVRFDERHDELVMVRRVPFSSLCEHHMLPFTGFATVGYVPRTGIVGLSKIARLVDAYARRLQVQERLTAQIADALTEHLDPLAVGVIVEAEHHCMAMRGIQRQAPMVTSCLRGVLRERADLRQEFLALAGY
jgi:GTP cyclohydrolase IA